MRNVNLFHSCIRKTLIIRGSPETSGWAHSRKATLSRVYAVKGIGPFCLGLVLARFVPGFVFLEGKQGVNGGQGVETKRAYISISSL